MTRAGSAILLTTLILSLTAEAAAEPTSKSLVDAPQHFAIGGQLGFFQGNGFSLTAGAAPLRLQASFGFMPILYSTDSKTDSKLHLEPSWQFDGDALVHLFTARGGTQIGFRPGYRYNSLLGHGFAIGGYAERRLSRAIALQASTGLSFFPDAAAQINEHLHDSSGSAATLPWLQAGVSVGLLFYP